MTKKAVRKPTILMQLKQALDERNYDRQLVEKLRTQLLQARMEIARLKRKVRRGIFPRRKKGG